MNFHFHIGFSISRLDIFVNTESYRFPQRSCCLFTQNLDKCLNLWYIQTVTTDTILSRRFEMESRETWEKQLCMSGLRVTHARYEREHHCDAGDGAAYARIVVALQGCADIRSPGLHLHIDSGKAGVFYIPEGAQYHIIWSGSPQIEYVIFGITARTYDTENIERYDMQCIEGADMDLARSAAAEIVSLFAANDRVSRVRAIGVYYHFYAQLLPYLIPIHARQTHSAVTAAMAYIESHYAEDFTMETLASAVCVSESRLFHLFRESLSATPVQYRISVRIRHAAEAIRGGQMSFDEIALQCGFHSAAYLRTCFKRELGLTPGEYREMNK